MPHGALRARLHQVRRRATLAAMHGALALGERLHPHHALSLGDFAGRLAGVPSPLRRRLARHMHLAGLSPTSPTLNRYFRLLGHWFGQSMAVIRRGFAESGLDQTVTLDASAAHLRTALAGGRGVLLAEFHYHCHEIGMAAVAHQFPVTAVVRESKHAAHDALKRRWYAACGYATVTRPRGPSLRGPLSLLSVLRAGRALVISPDARGPAGEGVPVTFFDRQVDLPAGLISLATLTGAPVVFCWPEWHLDPAGDRLVVRFDEPLTFPRGGDREATTRAGLQEWANRLEALLRRQPEVWMHWLDKQWSRVWRRER